MKLRKGQKERGMKTKKLLAAYEGHPLHRTTIHCHGFTMLTNSLKDELDATISTATTPTTTWPREPPAPHLHQAASKHPEPHSPQHEGPPTIGREPFATSGSPESVTISGNIPWWS